MGDILYGESSSLLAAIPVREFKQYNLERARSREEFLHKIYDTCPSLILIGDSLCSDIPALIFFLRSLPELQELPILFLGEQEQASLFPVDLVINREDLSEGDIKISLGKLLYQSRQKKANRLLEQSETPPPFDSEGHISKGSRASLLASIHEAYCACQMGTVDVSGGSHCFTAVLDQLMSILHTDFAYLHFVTSEGPVERILFRDPAQRAMEGEIIKNCQCFVRQNPFSDEGFEDTLSYKDRLSIPEVIGKGAVLSGNLVGKAYKINLLNTLKLSEYIVKTISLANRFQKKKGETDTIYSAFTKFLPTEIIDDLIIKDSDEDLMTGENRTIVVLFCHIRKFDQIMRDNSPADVVKFLNSHFSNMVEIIQWQGGSIDKFIGDAIYAIFGAPVSYPDNATRAAQAAIMMINEYANTDVSSLILPEEGFSIGVGLHQGKAIIGNIGCSEKFDYTAIGDTVNLSARLESLTKHYKVPILVSQEVKNHLPREFYSRLVDIACVKGKSEPTRIFSLEIEGEKFSDDWRDSYEKGVRMYVLGNWRIALKYLSHALELMGDDFPTQQFIDRCERFQEKPPERQWDGAVSLDFK
jgi:class 3 adenylate cyclase